jgi:hypothetical protein
VVRLVRRAFPSRDPDHILRLLDDYGTEKWHSEKDRVHIAILKLSQGDMEQLQRYVETATYDFRDVIAPAEYPEFRKVGFVGVSRMTTEEIDELRKADWGQYQKWLNRE